MIILHAGQQSERRQKIAICKLIRDTLLLCQHAVKSKRIALETIGIDCPIEVYCAPAQISQIVLGLIHNSLDAVGGREGAWISIELKQEGRKLNIMVTDSGPGIPASIQQDINQPFFTTKPGSKATGMGLSIGRRLAKENGGQLELDASHENTRFILTLPIYSGKKPSTSG